MKILLIHPHDLLDPHEPWTIRIESIAKEFLRMGHKVKVIHFMLDPYIEKYTMHHYGFEMITLQRRGGLQFAKEKIMTILYESKWADVIHFQKCFHYVSLPSLLGSLFYNKPLHYDWDDNEYAIYRASAHPPNWMNSFFIKTFERILPLLVDTLSVASEELKNFCRKLKIEEDIIFDAPVGADLVKFNLNINGNSIRKKYLTNIDNGCLIIYLGQLNGAQYTDLFIEAVAALKDKHKGVRFLIVGDGSKAHRLKAYARKLHVLDVLTFVGAVKHEAIPEYLAASDIAVACFDDNEITRCKSPLKVVEYLAAGKTIVASAVGEVKTMLDGCGILVKPGSSKALAAGIDEILSNPNKISKLSLKARKKAEEKYNWPMVAERLEKAYKKAFALRNNVYKRSSKK